MSPLPANIRFRPIADIGSLPEDERVNVLLLFALAAAAQAQQGGSRTFLLSIDALQIGPQESLIEFELDTWGVRFRAVCHIPHGWRVEAGGNATPAGRLVGRATHGVTQLSQERLHELRNLVLVDISGAVRFTDTPVENGVIPATFKGHVGIMGREGRSVELTQANLRLRPASSCPR